MTTSPSRRQLILGWIAVSLSILVTCFWAFWGIIENFHEGWYFRSFWSNIALMFGQYLSFMLASLLVALLAIRWPVVGVTLHIGIALFALWFFSGAHITVHLTFSVALFLIGVLYYFGRPSPKKWAYGLAIGLPLLTVIGFGIEPAWRVAHRHDDGNLDARIVEGNGVKLIWAPAGPGWPEEGVTWDEAKRRCKYLTEDGKSLAKTPQDIWRLPTVEESVRSMCRGGKHCGGVWESKNKRAIYKITPDKESPLWNIYSPVIYRWTGTPVDEKRAYHIVYHGRVSPRPKDMKVRYFSFRAVKDPK